MSQFFMGHFSSPEENVDLDLKSLREEFQGLVYPHVKIVLGDLGGELNFFYNPGFRGFARLFILFRQFVLKLAVVADLGDRRSRGRRDQNKIATALARQTKCFGGWAVAKLLSVFVNQSDFLGPNAFINLILFNC